MENQKQLDPKERELFNSISDLARRFTRRAAKKEIAKKAPSKFDNRLMRIREHASLHKVIREDVVPILDEWIEGAEDICDLNVKDHMVLVTQQGVKAALRRVKQLFEGQGEPERAP